jgi:hypothetical protein
MISLLNHLKQNWIKYGFETFTIIVGIFGALTIESWNEARKQQKDDLDFLLSLRNDLVISGGVLNRIDKELNQGFLNYLGKIKWHNSVVTKLGETLQDVMVHDIHSRGDLQYIDSLNITIKYEFNKIKKDRLIRNALNKSFGYRRVYTRRIKDQLDEAEELISLINFHLEE